VTLSSDNIQEFLKSFDTILCDCDGVLWGLGNTPYENVVDCLEVLRNDFNKTIFYVTNNSILTRNNLAHKFNKLGINCEPENVVFPALAIADHLKTIGFKKKALVFGTDEYRDTLREAGVDVLEREPYPQEERFQAVIDVIQKDADQIGAVISDCDININYIEITKASNVLAKNPDCMFFVGATEKKLPLSRGITLTGPGQFTQILEDMSGRKGTVMGKPSTKMVEFIDKYHHLDPDRTLFIGDTLHQDMGTAAAAGFRSLLVLSGVSGLKETETCSEDLVPHYVVPSLGDILKCLKTNKA